MCKHVAAVLYGIGNRLDQSPELLFTLRQVTVENLIARSIDSTTKDLISKADEAAGDDILADADLGNMFGIQLDDMDNPKISLPTVADSAKPVKSTKPKTSSKPSKSRGTLAPSATEAARREAGMFFKLCTEFIDGGITEPIGNVGDGKITLDEEQAAGFVQAAAVAVATGGNANSRTEKLAKTFISPPLLVT